MIEIVNGDKKIIEYTLTDSSGAAVDLTDFTIVMSVKRKDSDTSYLFQKTIANGGIEILAPATDGKFYLKIFGTDTEELRAGTYWYDIQMNDTTDSEVITIVGPAKFKVKKGITD